MFRRLNAQLLAPAAALVLIAGCASASQVCTKGICDITLEGKGASVDAGGDGSTVKLVQASSGSAEIDVDGTKGTLRTGIPYGFGQNSTITLVSVDGQKVKLKIDTTTAPEDAAAKEEGDAPATTPHADHTLGQSGRKGG